MSNKSNETMDGVFEIQPDDKPASKANHPPRPPKPKVPLSRETKVGLAVVGALLVILIVVLVIRLRGDGDQVADKSSAVVDSDASRERPISPARDASASGATVIPAKSANAAAAQYWNGQPSQKANRTQGNSVYGGGASMYGDPVRTHAGAASAIREEDEDAAVPDSSGYNSLTAQTDPVNAARGSAFQEDPSDPFSVRRNVGAAAGELGNASGMAISDDSESEGVTEDAAATSTFSENLADDAARGPTFGDDQRTASHAAGAKALSNPFDRTNRAKLGERATVRAQEESNSNEISVADAVEVAADDAGVGRGGGESESREEGRLLPAKDIDLQPTPHRGPSSSSVARGKQALTEAPPFGAARKSPVAAAELDEAVRHNDQRTAAALGQPRVTSAGQSYTVEADDTYWTIAQKTYGSGAYFKALYEHNRRQYDDADRLSAGMQLSVPDEATLQRLYPKLCPKPQRIAARGRATHTSAEVPANDATYVVKEGDTLYEIARRQLGRSSRWAEVYDLNRDAIGEATDRLEPGSTLVLPSNDVREVTRSAGGRSG